MDVDTGALTQLTDVAGTLRPLGFSRDRTRMVYSFTDFDTPPDLYSADISGHDEVRLTRANPRLEDEVALASADIVRWSSHDGTEIEGVLYRPTGYQEGTRVPLMLHVHGGPPGYFGNSFDFEFQLYAGLGYASLGPNVRGSSAYGDELLRGLMGDVGGGEYEDLMSGVDHVIELGIADPDQLGVRGWSWGGVLSSWVVTQTDRFKAASIGAMVGSWVAETGPGFNFDVTLWYIGGSHWENLDEWMKRSSLTHVGNVTTPSLILHGGEDTTSSVGQSLMFFTALRDRGVPTRFIKFPRQQHGVREPRLLRVLHVEETRWMEKYIRGRDWEPWVREER
jgi:dipeptidyl aminopeptidase/acylaminoacyl peptidase